MVKGLVDRLLRRALRKIDAAALGGPETRGALRAQVDNTPGRLLKLLVARALLKSRRKPRSERLAGLLLSLGAAVIGGPLRAGLQTGMDRRPGPGRGRREDPAGDAGPRRQLRT